MKPSWFLRWTDQLGGPGSEILETLANAFMEEQLSAKSRWVMMMIIATLWWWWRCGWYLLHFDGDGDGDDDGDSDGDGGGDGDSGGDIGGGNVGDGDPCKRIYGRAT